MKRLSDLIVTTVPQKEILRAARAQAVTRQWTDVVGEFLAEKTSPDRYERGTLWIQASSSVWAQEIRMREDTIVARLNDLAGERGLFEGIRVGTGPKRRDLVV